MTGIIKFLKAGLDAEHFIVDVAEDGERGAYLRRKNEYDLILLDISLPTKTGLEVCWEIREAGKTTLIIVVSVESETCIKVKRRFANQIKAREQKSN